MSVAKHLRKLSTSLLEAFLESPLVSLSDKASIRLELQTRSAKQ